MFANDLALCFILKKDAALSAKNVVYAQCRLFNAINRLALTDQLLQNVSMPKHKQPQAEVMPTLNRPHGSYFHLLYVCYCSFSSTFASFHGVNELSLLPLDTIFQGFISRL